MRSVLRRHPLAAFAGALLLVAAAGVALAPWWIDLRPVRAKIERAASTALAGTLTYERMDLSWFPHPEVVVRGLTLSVPGHARGTARTVRVSPSLFPLLRGRVVITKIGVEGLDLDVAVDAPETGARGAAAPASDWKGSLRSLGSQTLDVELGRSRLVLARAAGKSLVFEGIRLETALRVAGGKFDAALTRLSADSPRLALAGSLRADAAIPRVEVAARGSDLDVADVRGKLLSFAGGDPVVSAIFEVLRGGTLASFSFASSGNAPADLGRLERMSIRAAVKDGRVRVPGPNLDLAGVAADVALEGGVLTAENASARAGKSRAEGGRVLVGLAPGDDRLRVDARVRADLAEVPAILARVIRTRAFREEIALVEGLAGRAEARLTIGDRESALAASVAVSDMRFSATYRRLPWPVAVRGGRFFFDGERVGVSGLSGSLGRSTFSGVAARVRLGRAPVLEAASGAIVVSLGDFLEGARSLPGAASLVASVRRLEGGLHVGVRRFAGPLARLREASVDASGTFEEVLFESSSLPPLSIAAGSFSVREDAIRVSGVDARTLDAALRVSGAWKGWRGGEAAFEAAAEGELGPNAIGWGWKKASLPAAFRPRPPIAATGVRFGVAAGGAFSLGGSFTVGAGPRVTLDLAREGGTTEVRDLTIVDGETHAVFALKRPEGGFDATFKGRLEAGTIQRILEERPVRRGTLEGDVRVLVPAGGPGRLTAEGPLTATNLDVTTPAGTVTLERVALRASGSRAEVNPSTLVLDEQRIAVSGSATLRDGTVALDMDVGTDALAWTSVEKVLGRLEDAKNKTAAATATPTEAVEPAPAPGASAPLGVGGDLRVSLGSFAHGDLVWRPVLADVRLDRDAVEVRVRKADLCGVSTTGEARVLSGGVALDARVEAAGPDVNVPLTCLGLKDVRMTGAYEANARVSGEGKASGLARSLRGPVALKLTKGGIGKATVLTRILGVLNATEVFAGKTGTRVGDTMPYDAISVGGEVADGTVSIRESSFVAPSITMAMTGTIGFLDRSVDLMVLAHPLSTIDKIVQAVPVVRHVLGRDFLAVPVRVTGTLADPKATVTPAKDVGKGLIGILERTVTLPVTVFDPPAPERK